MLPVKTNQPHADPGQPIPLYHFRQQYRPLNSATSADSSLEEKRTNNLNYLKCLSLKEIAKAVNDSFESHVKDHEENATKDKKLRNMRSILVRQINVYENSLINRIANLVQRLLSCFTGKTTLDKANNLLLKLDNALKKSDNQFWKNKSQSLNQPCIISWDKSEKRKNPTNPKKFHVYIPDGTIYNVRTEDFNPNKEKRALAAAENRIRKVYTATKKPANKKGEIPKETVVALTNLPANQTFLQSHYKEIKKEAQDLQTEYLNLKLLKKGGVTVVTPYHIASCDHNEIPLTFVFEEFCEKGDLSFFLESNEKLELNRKKELIGSLIEQIFKLHTTQVYLKTTGNNLKSTHLVHTDIKTQNIGVRQDRKGNLSCQLFDVESVRPVNTRNELTTWGYRPPEYVHQTGFVWREFRTEKKQKFDVWSLGLVLYQIYHGKRIDNIIPRFVEFGMIDQKTMNIAFSNPMTDPIEKLIHSMLLVDVNERPNMAQVKKRWKAINQNKSPIAAH